MKYIQQIETERAERDARVKASPRNWLSLTGLFRLDEGEHPFGNTSDLPICLPSLSHPRCGVLHVDAGQVSLVAAAPGLYLNGEEPALRALSVDVDGEPDLLTEGPVSMMIIRRNGIAYLRVWDITSPLYQHFSGFYYFPVDPHFRIQARFIPYSPLQPTTIRDALGETLEIEIAGKATFTLDGVSCELEIQADEEGGLINFTDATRTYLTYPGGRWLEIPSPLQEDIILDFNRAFNWPCAYTPWATCPLPPTSNHLSVRILAGEKRYHA